MTHLGFDISTYPGDTSMRAWFNNTPLSFTGFYLAPAPNHFDTSWMQKRSLLKEIGWGLLPVYVGLQAGDSNLTAAQGTADAQDAAKLASQAGFPENTIVYLDVEMGGELPAAFLAYITAFLKEMRYNTPYAMGVYCSYFQTAEQIAAAVGDLNGLTPSFWVFNINTPPSPGAVLEATSITNSGYAGAGVWQYAQNCEIVLNDVTLQVDLSVANSTNPSNG